VGASQIPFGFGELLILDADPHCGQRDIAALLNQAVVTSLAAYWIQITPLHLPEAGDGLPHTASRCHIDGVLGLPEADGERCSLGIVLRHGSKILIKKVSQARPIARRLRRRSSSTSDRNEDTH